MIMSLESAPNFSAKHPKYLFYFLLAKMHDFLTVPCLLLDHLEENFKQTGYLCIYHLRKRSVQVQLGVCLIECFLPERVKALLLFDVKPHGLRSLLVCSDCPRKRGVQWKLGVCLIECISPKRV